MSNNNWNDPNAGQQGWNPDPNAQQGWDAQQPASDAYGQQPQQQGWDAQPQPSADPYAQPQQQGWDAQPQPSADPYAQPGQGYGQADPYAQQQAYGAPTGYDQGMNPYGGYAMAQPKYASWGKRALGGLIDFVLPSIVISVLVSVLFPGDTTTSTTSTSASYMVQGTGSVVQNILGLAWYAVLAYLASKDGQTPGRKVAKTRLITESGAPMSFGMGFVRYLAHFVDAIICCVGYLFPLWDKERQTLADKIMKTHVIDAE